LPPRWEKVSFSISSLEPRSILTFGRMYPKSHYLAQRVFNIRARAAGKGAPEAISLLEEVVKIQEQTLLLRNMHIDGVAAVLVGAYQGNGQVKEAVSLLENYLRETWA
jgi:hypothetical protein